MSDVVSINARRADIAISALEKLTLADIGALDFERAARLHSLCKQWQTNVDNSLSLKNGVVPVYWPWGPKR